MEKRYKYVVPYLSRDLLYQKIHPSRDAAFGADCLIPLGIMKIITVGLKNGLWCCYQELLHVTTCSKNCQFLICSPLEIKSLHLLSKFRGYIFLNRSREK